MDRFSIAHYAQNCKWKSKKILCKPESHEKTADFSGNFHRLSEKKYLCSGGVICNFLQRFDKTSNFLKRLFIFSFKKNRKFLWQQSVIWKLPNLFRIHTRKRCFYTLHTFYFSGTEASGANIYVAGSTLHNCLYSLYIGLPCSVGASVRVGHLDTECNTLTAKFAFCHILLHLLKQTNGLYYIILQQKMQALFFIFWKFFLNIGNLHFSLEKTRKIRYNKKNTKNKRWTILWIYYPWVRNSSWRCWSHGSSSFCWFYRCMNLHMPGSPVFAAMIPQTRRAGWPSTPFPTLTHSGQSCCCWRGSAGQSPFPSIRTACETLAPASSGPLWLGLLPTCSSPLSWWFHFGF